MNNFPTCAGCFINPSYPFPPFATPPVGCCFLPPPYQGLTVEEQQVLKHLVDAYNAFVALQDKHPDDNDEFRSAIHDAQRAVAIRVARRVDPHIWAQPMEDAHGSAEPECLLG